MAVAVAVVVAVSGGGAVAVPVAGLTFFLYHNQKDFLINVWGYGRFLTKNTLPLTQFFCFQNQKPTIKSSK